MRIRRGYLTAILATAPISAAIFATFNASPPQLNAHPGVEGCVDVAGVSACASADIGVPNINAVDNVVPDVNVPNINMPNINPGHVGLPGRGR